MIGLSHPWMDKITGERDALRPGLANWTRVGAGLALMLAAWAASGFSPLATGGAKDGVIGLLAAASWWLFDRTRTGILLGVLTGVAGTLAEIIQVRAGTFFYWPAHQNLGGVPSWLPFVYFSASVAVGNLGRALAYGLTEARSPARDP